MPKYSWPGEDDRSVVAEMLTDLHSPHWEECSSFVEKYILGKFPLLPEHLQREAVQNTMLSVHRGLSDFRFDSRFTTWLIPIAHNRAIDLYRKFKIEAQSQVSQKADTNEPDDEEDIFRTDVSSSPVEVLLIIEELEEARAALQKFIQQHKNRERNARILDMVLYNGHSCEETAQALGIKAPLVSYIVREARKYLGAAVSHWTPGPPSHPPFPDTPDL